LRALKRAELSTCHPRVTYMPVGIPPRIWRVSKVGGPIQYTSGRN